MHVYQGGCCKAWKKYGDRRSEKLGKNFSFTAAMLHVLQFSVFLTLSHTLEYSNYNEQHSFQFS